MLDTAMILFVAALALIAFRLGWRRVVVYNVRQPRPINLPVHGALWMLLWSTVPTLIALLLVAWTAGSLAFKVLACAMGVVGFLYASRTLTRNRRIRPRLEFVLQVALMLAAAFAIVISLAIVLTLLAESWRFFSMVSPIDFFFGLTWSPQTALRADQVGSSGSFGAIPLFLGTFLISAIALLVAVPIGLLSAFYLTQYASARVRSICKPMLEILAGVPTVVYGFFSALMVAPFLRNAGISLGLDVSSESALAAGAVMGVMLIPFVSSISDDAIRALPSYIQEGSLALGATVSETLRRALLPAALPGIAAGILLAASRAIGETMIVVMAAGIAAKLTVNPLESATTVTVQIVGLLTGDQEFDSAKTLAAFALGLTLFCITLALNMVGLHIVDKHAERTE